MKKHYIKLNLIYAWAWAEYFFICHWLHIKKERREKKIYFSVVEEIQELVVDVAHTYVCACVYVGYV